MAQRFEAEQWVPFPVELVFAFFANPMNLPHMFPPQVRARIEDVRIQPPPVRPVAQDPARRLLSVAAGVGTEILISFYPIPWVPTRMSWMAQIVEFTWNSHFVDEQTRGPFRSFRHRHGIASVMREGMEGTLVSDRIDFALPWSWAGRLGEPVVRRQLRKSFAYRHKRLPEILAAAQAQAARGSKTPDSDGRGGRRGFAV